MLETFRSFQVTDPFDRQWEVEFRWQQNAISIRHADTVDVRFVMQDDGGARTQKTIALPHADLLAVSKQIGRQMDDAWCARLAMKHLLYLVETGEDMEKELVTVPIADLKRYAAALAEVERQESHAA